VEDVGNKQSRIGTQPEGETVPFRTVVEPVNDIQVQIKKKYPDANHGIRRWFSLALPYF
jgi:hypothetical protein